MADCINREVSRSEGNGDLSTKDAVPPEAAQHPLALAVPAFAASPMQFCEYGYLADYYAVRRIY